MPVGEAFTMQGFGTGFTGYNTSYTALAGTTGLTMVGQTAVGGGACPTTPVTSGFEGTVRTIQTSCSADSNTVMNKNVGPPLVNWNTVSWEHSQQQILQPSHPAYDSLAESKFGWGFRRLSRMDAGRTGARLF